MEKFPAPGKSSSKPKISRLRALSELAASPAVKPIIEALGSRAALHLVGGTVRDALCGLERVDIDLACSFSPEESARLLRGAGLHVVETGLQHGTLTVVCDGENVELTSFRTASEQPATLASDLAARDFTINAMAFDPARGELIDPMGGFADLEARVARAAGSPADRFSEDPLRILRLARFGPAEGRSVDQATEAAVPLHRSRLSEVSVERIKLELEKILMSSDPRAGLAYVERLGLLTYVLPGAIPSVGVEQNEFHVEDVFQHTLSVIENSPPERIVRLAALFHDLGKPHTLSVGEGGARHFYKHELVSEEICKTEMKRLRFSNDDIKAVSTLVRHHMRPLDCGPAGVRRLMRDLGEYFPLWEDLKKADRPPRMKDSDFERSYAEFRAKVETELERAKGSVYDRLAVDGDDLQRELGMKPGVELGQILKHLRELVTDNPELNDRESLLREARERLGQA